MANMLIHPAHSTTAAATKLVLATTGAFALSALTHRGAEAHRMLLGPLPDLARRYEGVGFYTCCDHDGQLIAMKQDQRLISDVDYYIVHSNTSVAKGILS